jgi:hypothetical protein
VTRLVRLDPQLNALVQLRKLNIIFGDDRYRAEGAQGRRERVSNQCLAVELRGRLSATDPAAAATRQYDADYIALRLLAHGASLAA